MRHRYANALWSLPIAVVLAGSPVSARAQDCAQLYLEASQYLGFYHTSTISAPERGRDRRHQRDEMLRSTIAMNEATRPLFSQIRYIAHTRNDRQACAALRDEIIRRVSGIVDRALVDFR